MAQLWEVVGGADKGGILVRAGRSTNSKAYDNRLATGSRLREVELSGDRLHYRKVTGNGPDYGWVTTKMGGKDLVKKLPKPEALKKELIQAEHVPEVLASEVLAQLERELFGFPGGGRPPLLQAPRQFGAVAAETTPAGAEPIVVNLAEGRQEGARQPPAHFQAWLDKAKQWLARLNARAKVPETVRLPPSAVGWEPAAAVLHALTHGQFDPERDLTTSTGAAVRSHGLVSMVCATSDRRRSFHRLVYENFLSQTYEPRELVVVHTGEMPSDFFMEMAQEDARVLYRFFPVTREAPGSPRLSDEKMGNPWDAVLLDDEVENIVEFTTEVDFCEYEVRREGWTKGIKRNIGACIARGEVIIHCDEGCLYASDYLSRMHAELSKMQQGVGMSGPAAVALSRWYTMAVKDQEFRLVDLRQKEGMWDLFNRNPSTEQVKEQFNFGFAHAYTRAAWEQQPHPDVETVATSDGAFMRALQKMGVPVALTGSYVGEGLAACGWHRDATCGSVDACANINYSTTLCVFAFRGEEVVSTPKVFKRLLPSVKEVAAELGSRRERYLRDLVEEYGSVHVCAYCNFAVALADKAEGGTKEFGVRMHVFDAVDRTQTIDKARMKSECGYFTAAGGCVAEGEYEEVPPGHGWLSGKIQRMAICRNCGWQLGWRFEPESNRITLDQLKKVKGVEEKAKRSKELPPLQGPLTWALVWRHLRERRKPGEFVPEDPEKEPPRHSETEHNKGRADVCPAGHRLHCFPTGAYHLGHGGALPLFYTCDLCDQDARGNQHFWGCGTCDYDICDGCKEGRRGRPRKALE